MPRPACAGATARGQDLKLTSSSARSIASSRSGAASPWGEAHAGRRATAATLAGLPALDSRPHRTGCVRYTRRFGRQHRVSRTARWCPGPRGCPPRSVRASVTEKGGPSVARCRHTVLASAAGLRARVGIWRLRAGRRGPRGIAPQRAPSGANPSFARPRTHVRGSDCVLTSRTAPELPRDSSWAKSCPGYTRRIGAVSCV